MEKAILIIVIICITVGCISVNKEHSAKEITYEVLSEIIKQNDLTKDSIYVVIPFGGKIDFHEIYVSKSVVPIHLYSDFEVDTINGMKILFSTGEELKADTSYYQKSIDAGIVVLDKRIFWEEDRSKNLVIIQCMENNKRGIYKLVDYEEENKKSQIISTLCSREK